MTGCATQQLGSVVLQPGAAHTTNRVLAPLRVRVLSTNNGGQSPSFEVNDAVFAADQCGSLHHLAGARSGESFTQASLPLGTYTLRYRRAGSTGTPQDTSPVTTVSLSDPATTNPATVTLQYVR